MFLGGTSNHLPAIAAVVMEINEHLQDVDDIVIYLDWIDKKQIEILKSLSKINIIVKKYNLFLGTRYKNPNIQYFSPMVFCKFEGFKLLNDYKKVIWTDYDVVIKQDINELLHEYSTGLYTLDTFDARAVNNFYEPVEGLNMDAKAACCGLVIFNDDIINYNKIYHDCYKFAKKYIDYLKLVEQAVFNIVIDRHNIPMNYLDPHIYSCGVEEACIKYQNDAKIFHSYGVEKFWNGRYNEIYQTNYEKWLAAGGKEITKKRKRSRFTKIMQKFKIV